MEKCASNDFYTFLEVEYENIWYYFCISLKKKLKLELNYIFPFLFQVGTYHFVFVNANFNWFDDLEVYDNTYQSHL